MEWRSILLQLQYNIKANIYIYIFFISEAYLCETKGFNSTHVTRQETEY